MAHAAHADFTLGVSRPKGQTTFFPIRVFGKLAESCENNKKGAKVLVETATWTFQSIPTRKARRGPASGSWPTPMGYSKHKKGRLKSLPLPPS